MTKIKLPRLVHISFDGAIQLDYTNNSSDTDNISIKPNGLWYAYKNTWLKFMETDMGIKPSGYLFEITIDPGRYTTNVDEPDTTKIFKLTSENIIKFVKKYEIMVNLREKLKKDFNKYPKDQQKYIRTIIKYTYDHISIYLDWKRICKDYAGFEYIPLLNKKTPYIDTKSYKILDEYFDKKYNSDKKYDRNRTQIVCFGIFDVPSGCIWNSKALYNIRYIGKIASNEKGKQKPGYGY